MTEWIVCAPLYEAARPFVRDFAAALIAALEGRDARVVLAADGFAEPEGLIAQFANSGSPADLITMPVGTSPAAVRAALLTYAYRTSARYIAFADCDDLLERDALDHHGSALADADFSYGDQILVDADGWALGGTLYGSWHVPAVADTPDALMDGNFAGFSGAALRRSSLTPHIAAVPNSILACDWWLFARLLHDGARGRKTVHPVVRYRQWGGNIHGGAEPPSDNASFSLRVEIARRHFAALPDTPDVIRRRIALEELALQLSSDPSSLRTEIQNAVRDARCWYADAISLALNLHSQRETICR